MRNAIGYSRKGKFKQHRALLRRPWLGQTGRANTRIPTERRVLGEAGTGPVTCGLPRHHLRPQGLRKVQPAEHRLQYATFAEDLRTLITHLKLYDFSLVGFSMGGGEVARYLGKYGSKDVSKAVIISGVSPFLLKT